MSTPKRRITVEDRPGRDEQGNRICRWCRGPVTDPRRRTMCSKECAHEYNLRSNSAYLRWHIFDRDQGVCAECGLDTDKLHQKFRELSRWLKRRSHRGYRRLCHAFLDRHGLSQDRTTFWDADHITPVEEGGGECGLEGYQTLCIPCHKRKTAEQARQKAERRRGQTAMELGA